jgi:hypothetical protein
MRGQLMKYFTQVPTQHAEYSLLTPLQYEDYVIFAVPSRMAQALILFHCEFPFSWRRLEIHADRGKGQTLVSPPGNPGAYLFELAQAAVQQVNAGQRHDGLASREANSACDVHFFLEQQVFAIDAVQEASDD